MQFGQLLHGHLVYLQVPFLAASFLVHHPYEVAKPVGLFLLLLVGIVETVDILAPYP